MSERPGHLEARSDLAASDQTVKGRLVIRHLQLDLLLAGNSLSAKEGRTEPTTHIAAMRIVPFHHDLPLPGL
ncbi:MAG: hypothetical protein U9R51_05875, partial [Actinomycetota bacterium]|nr:hypothetical protein [Actinomycetota bacterium]